MTPDEVQHRIDTEEDFIFARRFDFSLAKFQARYPDGAPVRVIAQALACSEDEVEELYQGVVAKLREAMKADL